MRSAAAVARAVRLRLGLVKSEVRRGERPNPCHASASELTDLSGTIAAGSHAAQVHEEAAESRRESGRRARMREGDGRALGDASLLLWLAQGLAAVAAKPLATGRAMRGPRQRARVSVSEKRGLCHQLRLICRLREELVRLASVQDGEAGK